MGRVRLQMKKIENKTYRHITFAKRKSGLLKKAYEISTLCDVEVALIIFSPAGKLILFDGKKRLHEIFLQFLDLPYHQGGRLRDQELVRRIVDQLSVEAELHHHLALDNNNRDQKRNFDCRLEEIENGIRKHSAELGEVEKQLQYFLRSPNSVKSVGEAEFLEGILEDALKLVSTHKQNLINNKNFQVTGSETMDGGGGGGLVIGRGAGYCMGNWLPESHYGARVMNGNDVYNSFSQFQPLRAEGESPASAMPYVCGIEYPTVNYSVSSVCYCYRPEINGCHIHRPQAPCYEAFYNTTADFCAQQTTAGFKDFNFNIGWPGHLHCLTFTFCLRFSSNN